MDDFAYMRQAMELAEQAAALGEIPVGALVVQDAQGRSWAGDTTVGRWIMIPLPTQRCLPSGRRLWRSAAGGCPVAPSM